MKLMLRQRPQVGNEAPDSWNLQAGSEIRPGLVAQELLGGGNRYEAYLAHDEFRMCLVVAKVIRPSRAGEERSIRAMAREFGILRQLDHPVIARGFDVFLDGPRPHITLEHLEGPRLSTLLRRYGPLPMDQLLPLTLQLGAALQYLHHCGVVHLDVKPKNIIMSGPPRVIDLSVADTFEAAAGLTVPTGTDGYMSPEQHDPSGPVSIGPASDSWGLGATLFEAAQGYLPSAGLEAEGARRRSGRRTPVPQVWDEAVGRCFSNDPAERPSPRQLMGLLEPMAAVLPTRFPLSPPRPGR
jgi:serine/threonine protein kinase